MLPAATPSTFSIVFLRCSIDFSRSGLFGPRLLPLEAPASQPLPAAEGRDWNHCGRGLPFLSTKPWPISAEPTTLPF